MLSTALLFHQLYIMMAFVFLIHFWLGFSYNTYFTYSLTSRPHYAATASGLASGGSYVIFSIASYVVVNLIDIKDQLTLGLAYLVLLVCVRLTLIVVRQALQKAPTVA